MKDTAEKEGFNNRHIVQMPLNECLMIILYKDTDGEHLYLCKWNPFHDFNYSENDLPAKGYLGTAKIIDGEHSGIGFHAWEQNNSEFIYYLIVNP